MKLFRRKSKKNTVSESDDLGDIAIKLAESGAIKKPEDDNHNSFGEPLDKLVNGELPWGWVGAKREFVGKIQNEYGYFLNRWISARNKNPKDEYAALKSFVLYMQDVKKLCASKGECYEFWCNEILIGKGYLEKRTEELKDLENNLEDLEEKYKKRAFFETEILPNLENELLKIIKENPGIIQKDIYKKFDQDLKSDISSLLYFMAKDGKIKREKAGNSYKLNIK